MFSDSDCPLSYYIGLGGYGIELNLQIRTGPTKERVNESLKSRTYQLIGFFEV